MLNFVKDNVENYQWVFCKIILYFHDHRESFILYKKFSCFKYLVFKRLSMNSWGQYKIRLSHVKANLIYKGNGIILIISSFIVIPYFFFILIVDC